MLAQVDSTLASPCKILEQLDDKANTPSSVYQKKNEPNEQFGFFFCLLFHNLNSNKKGESPLIDSGIQRVVFHGECRWKQVGAAARTDCESWGEYSQHPGLALQTFSGTHRASTQSCRLGLESTDLTNTSRRGSVLGVERLGGVKKLPLISCKENKAISPFVLCYTL